MAPVAVVYNNRLVFDRVPYFRVGAESMRLGSFGEKRQPAGRMYLQRQGDLSLQGVTVTTVSGIDASFDRGWSLELGSILPDMGGAAGGGGLEVTISRIASGQLKLLGLSVDLAALKKAVDASPEVSRCLRALGPDARLVHALIAIVDGTLSQGGSSSFQASGTLAGDTMTLTGAFTAGSSSRTTTVLSRGSTFAYLLCKPHWGRKSLERLTIDEFGSG